MTLKYYTGLWIQINGRVQPEVKEIPLHPLRRLGDVDTPKQYLGDYFKRYPRAWVEL